MIFLSCAIRIKGSFKILPSPIITESSSSLILSPCNSIKSEKMLFIYIDAFGLSIFLEIFSDSKALLNFKFLFLVIFIFFDL